MKKKRYNEEQIIGAIKQHESGVTVEEICRDLGISNGRRLRTRQLKMNFLIQAVVLTWGKGQPLLNKSENTVRVLQPYA